MGDLVTLLPVADEDQVTPPRPPLSLPLLPLPEPNPSSSMSSDLRPSTSKSPMGNQGRRSPVLMPFSNTQIPSIQVSRATSWEQILSFQLFSYLIFFYVLSLDRKIIKNNIINQILYHYILL